MKVKNKLIICTLSVLLVLMVAVVLIKVNAASTKDSSEHVYYTNFEGMVVNEGSTVDNNTGFIWCNYWQKTRTIQRNGSTLLEMPIYDNETYSTVGGFGISFNSNLGKCVAGEAYDVQTYFEFENTEYMFVEFVGGDGKWGCVILYSDGRVMERAGGTNMSNVSYVDNILKFTFTMSFNENEQVNGYIKFTAYNAKNAKLYIDNVSIDYAEHVIDDSYEQMPIGTFDTTVESIFNHYYVIDEAGTSEFFKDGNNTKAKMSVTLDQNEEAVPVFFINKLGFINKNREYTLSIDLNTINVDTMRIYHCGTWASELNYIEINLKDNSISSVGNVFSEATYSNGKLSFNFHTNVPYAEYNQFQFVLKATEANVESAVILDNFRITQTPTVNGMILNLKGVKVRYVYGEEADFSNLGVTLTLSNNQTVEIDSSLCTITGYNPMLAGKQLITVEYQGFTKEFSVNVSRVVNALTVNVDELKTTYQYGEDIDLSNLKVVASFVDGGAETELIHKASLGGYAIDLGGYDKYAPGTYTITIYYLDCFRTFEVVVGAGSGVSFGDYTYQTTGK